MFRKIQIPGYTRGVITIIAGIVFVLFPEYLSGIIGIVTGIFLIVAGIVGTADFFATIRKFREENYGKAVGAELVLIYSIGITLMGIFFLSRPNYVTNALAIVMGIIFIFDGIVKFRQAMFSTSKTRFILFVLAVLTTAIGISLIVNPYGGTVTIITVIGISLIISGVGTVTKNTL